VKTGQLALTEGGVISGSSFTDGLGGTVEVTATDAITISGGSALFSNAFGNGNAGKIAVTAPTIRMQEGGIQAFTVGKGIAGNILVEVGTLTLTDGANINSVTIGPMPGAGRGGTVRVNADSITIAGRSSSGSIPGLFSVTQGSGDAGSIEVKTRRLTLTESGEISSSTFGAGLGGTVTVNATESVTIDGFQVDLEGTVFPSGLFSITKGSGQGGNIHLQAPHIQLTDRAVITAESTGTNNAGTITITAHEMFLSGNSAVTTEAQKTDGGDITLNAQALVRLRDSKITATVGGGKNTVGGNIAIDPEFVILENSEIKANAFEGRGGNIRISAGLFLADPASRVSASSARGIDGEVDIRAPIADLSGSLTQLPQTLLSAAALLRQRCAERLSGGQTSSFVLRGRDGLPLEPSNLLPSPLPVIGETATQVLGNRREMRSMNTSRISLLSPEDKRLPTVGGINVQGFSQAAWDVGCSRW
jgi:large exoprotein involved in heme utilization and adhesion